MRDHKIHIPLSSEAARIAEVAARRTLQLLRNEGLVGEMLTAAEVAARLKVERAWVYRHREELGSVRLGAGPNAPIRFPAERIAEFTASQRSRQDDANGRGKAARSPRLPRGPGAAPLLRFRGDQRGAPAGE